MVNKAVFFDRDDTLLVDTNYMHKVEDLLFVENCFETLKEVQSRGYLLFIVTNQSGIGRGYFGESDMHTFHKEMLFRLEENQIKITDIAFCPHTPNDQCDCRKPSPKMLIDLCKKYDIDPQRSFMIGDKTSDVLAGKNADMRSIGINCGAELQVSSLKEILDFI